LVLDLPLPLPLVLALPLALARLRPFPLPRDVLPFVAIYRESWSIPRPAISYKHASVPLVHYPLYWGTDFSAAGQRFCVIEFGR